MNEPINTEGQTPNFGEHPAPDHAQFPESHASVAPEAPDAGEVQPASGSLIDAPAAPSEPVADQSSPVQSDPGAVPGDVASVEDTPVEDATLEAEASPAFEVLMAAVENIDKRLGALEERDAKVAEQLQNFRDESARTFLQPMFKEMVGIYSDLLQSADYACENDAEAFRGYADHISYLLNALDLEVIPTDEETAFNARSHASVQKKSTDDKALDSTIARVVRHGLRVVGADRALVPARVAVFKYKKPVDSIDESVPVSSEVPETEPSEEAPDMHLNDSAFAQRDAGSTQ